MNTPMISRYYAELLEGTYDCADRVVLNAYFPVGKSGGGLRSSWRLLRGDDSDLDDAHLREMAGTFSRRLSAYCAKHSIPLIEAQAGERKHELAEPYLPADQVVRIISGAYWQRAGAGPGSETQCPRPDRSA